MTSDFVLSVFRIHDIAENYDRDSLLMVWLAINKKAPMTYCHRGSGFSIEAASSGCRRVLDAGPDLNASLIKG